MDHKDNRLHFTKDEAALLDSERSYPDYEVLRLGHLVAELVAIREDIIAEFRVDALYSQRGRILGLANEINKLYKLQRDLDNAAKVVHPELFFDSEL